ncbi:MAG: hypothetical protein QOF76_33 [Solirubrobacteraceae bacterium]|jgi:hypothetical protein|nr:hypothetical protein [Solirubrobacteraceae bacterium]
MADKPYSRDAYNKALIFNALLDPFNVVILAVLLIAGILVSPALFGVAGVAYLGGAARTYFDQDAANKVLEREKGKRQKGVGDGTPRLDESTLTPGIARLVHASRDREQRIRQAIESADLPYGEVAGEVDRFVAAMESTARRAQSLADALRDTPPDNVEARLKQIQNDPSKAELRDALQIQLKTLTKMQEQLRHFGDEMERILVELDTIRGQIVSVGASTGADQSQQLAGEVRDLREQMGAVADGMAKAYEATP